MTDEERHRLCANLRADAFALTPSFAGHNRMAADEIERLIKELHISNKALSMCSDECNRSYELIEKFEARHKKEIERLTAENERLREDAECWRRQND